MSRRPNIQVVATRDTLRERSTLADLDAIRLLVVEDNDPQVTYLRVTLGPLGFRITATDRLDAARHLLGGSVFDAILLDLSLPDSDGFATYRAIHERARHLPIIIFSNNGDEALAEQAMMEGAQDYVVKGSADGRAIARSIRHAVLRQRWVAARAREAREVANDQVEMVIDLLADGLRNLAEGRLGVRLLERQEAPSQGPGRVLLGEFDRAMDKVEQTGLLNTYFHSMAAHDMRSPLGTILLAASRLESSPTSADRERWISLIRMATQRQLRLVESLLDLYTLHHGHLCLQQDWVSINDMLRQVASEHSRQAELRRQEIEVEPLPGDDRVWADATRLYRVLDNLVLNALKYSVNGDTILLRATEASGGMLRLEIVDNGPGIPREEQSRVFDKFRRGDAGAGSAGLGLAICKELVEAHNGSIWVENRPSGGSRFVVIMPRSPVTLQSASGK